MQNNRVVILNKNANRQKGKEAQMSIISAAKAVADIVRTTLGPRAMLKMLLDPSGNAILTNDGASILREIEVAHPAAKSIIQLSRTQDERVGDGTTSVVVLAGELIAAARPFLVDGMHPLRVVEAYRAAEQDCIEALNQGAKSIDTSDRAQLCALAACTLGTKFTARFGSLLPELAVDAVTAVRKEGEDVDVKGLVKVEKVAGGEMTDSKVLAGVMLNKDVLHSAMRRKISNPRIILLESALEYKKAESETNIEMSNPAHWRRYLELEEEHIRSLCASIKLVKPDVVICEKGVSDMAQHFLLQANISVIRRVRKSDLHRLALAASARVCCRPGDITEKDVGTGCKLFQVRKLGDDYWSFFEECTSPQAVSVLLRGASRDVLGEVERNLADAVGTVRNVLSDPRVLPGGGATEASLAARLRMCAPLRGESVEIQPYLAAANALEIIPKTLAENCGAKVNRVVAKVSSAHNEHLKSKNADFCTTGVDGKKGEVANMKELNIWEPLLVKKQSVKTAFEAATTLLRIDDILSGISKKGDMQSAPQQMPMQ